jgi:hypothetical protein
VPNSQVWCVPQLCAPTCRMPSGRAAHWPCLLRICQVWTCHIWVQQNPGARRHSEASPQSSQGRRLQACNIRPSAHARVALIFSNMLQWSNVRLPWDGSFSPWGAAAGAGYHSNCCPDKSKCLHGASMMCASSEIWLATSDGPTHQTDLLLATLEWSHRPQSAQVGTSVAACQLLP